MLSSPVAQEICLKGKKWDKDECMVHNSRTSCQQFCVCAKLKDDVHALVRIQSNNSICVKHPQYQDFTS